MHPEFSYKSPPPEWFFVVYAAITQGLKLDDSATIYQQPIYLTNRYQAVYEAMKQANVEIAKTTKAMAVFDTSRFHKY